MYTKDVKLLFKIKKIKVNIDLWFLLSCLFIVLIILPNIDIVAHIFTKGNSNWYHIKRYLLKDYILNSIKITLATGIFTVIIGTSLSWLIAAYEFPLRKFFKWALILPMAIPPYIAAYTYNGIFNYTGIVQKFFRYNLGINLNSKYLDIMSIKGAVFIFTFSLFPYIFMITKAFLEKQSASLIENARLLGRSSLEIFFLVVVPISRGAIVGGTVLVVLEVLNDYGVVSYFGIPTFSTAIFKTWFSMGDINSAVKLSSILMFIVFTILVLEKWIRGKKRYSFTNTKFKPISRIKLKGGKAFLASAFCFIIFSISFVVPTLQLFSWSLLTYKEILSFKFINIIFNSLWIALFSSIIITIMAIIIANFSRIHENFIGKLFSKITILGYSTPASVIAIGVILLFVGIDRKLYGFYKVVSPNSQNLVLSTSIFMLIFAYIVRFLAISYQSIESGFEKVGKKFFEASRTLGKGTIETFFKVDFPMIKPAIISGVALAFVDIIKELPLTLILRPFNFNTLATKAFEYANDEMIHEASIASLIIIIISIFSIYLLNKVGDREVQ